MRRVVPLVGLLVCLLAQPSLFGVADEVAFGRVVTASSVERWGSFTAKSEFQPGDAPWGYAETFGTARGGNVAITFRFQVLRADGTVILDATSPFQRASQSANFGAWRRFVLPPRVSPGAYRLRVDVVD